jgi:hypothetical protein
VRSTQDPVIAVEGRKLLDREYVSRDRAAVGLATARSSPTTSRSSKQRSGELEGDGQRHEPDGEGLCSIIVSLGEALCSIVASLGAALCSIIASLGEALCSIIASLADGAAAGTVEAAGAVQAPTRPAIVRTAAREPVRTAIRRRVVMRSLPGHAETSEPAEAR